MTHPYPTPAVGQDGPVAYLSGFGNGFETEALRGALPIGRNSPQRCAYGLYAEQLSGSPFTAPRATNERSWLYRIRPTLQHWGTFDKLEPGLWRTAPEPAVDLPIGPMRWSPIPVPATPQSFLEGVRTMTTAGDAGSQAGMGAHVYLVTRSMVDEYFYDADGELLFVPQQGALRLWTEFGIIDVEPGEIAVIPRGVKLRVELPDGPARGYLCENYGGAFTLPERGPIGANCLANPRDFLTPVAAYEQRDGPARMFVKWGGALWTTALAHSPLDVVAWHGNYAPYKYDLRRFSPVGPLLFDHADPSIFTVLTSPSETRGTANLDFVIFPERWAVAENTFRPPWYHMNVMSEFMGLVYGRYEAKPHGFAPGGCSLHNTMLPHGPDVDAFEAASHAELTPHKLEATLAFMFETRFMQRVTAWAAGVEQFQHGYGTYGTQLQTHFDPTRPVAAMHIHLVDGTYELFRHYHAVPPARDRDGREVAAVRGVLHSLLGMVRQGATHIGVATDHVIESFRNDLWPGYKTGAGIPPDLWSQFALLEEVLGAAGFVVWPMVDVEADDALATAARLAAEDSRVTQVHVCSPDKDLAQCVRGTRVVQELRRARLTMDESGIVAKFGVPPRSMPDYLALVGDAADGYPGVRGWGARSAAVVLARYEHLEAIPADYRAWTANPANPATLARNLAAQRDDVFLFRTLARLREDVPLCTDVDSLRWTGPTEGFEALAARLDAARTST